MAYSFEQVFAADPSNPANVARNAAVTIFAPGDVAQTPLTLTTPNGDPLANPLQVNNNGFGSAFMHATLDRVAWSGGNFTGFFTSYEGMKAEAVSARTAAQTAASTAGADAAAVATAAIGTATDDAEAAATSAAAAATAAANSAALVGAPADAAIAAAINGTGTATKTALSATFVPNPNAANLVASMGRLASRAGSQFRSIWMGHSFVNGSGATTRDKNFVNRLDAGLQAHFNVQGAPGAGAYLPAWDGRTDAKTANYIVETGTPVMDVGWGYGDKTVKIPAAARIKWPAFFGTGFSLSYGKQASSPIVTVSINGVDQPTFDASAASAGDGFVWTSPALPLGWHTVRVSSAGGSFVLNGIHAYNGNETKGLHTINAGHSSYTTADYLTNLATTFPGLISRVNTPHLFGIMCLANDYYYGIAPATTQANLVTIINAVKANTPVAPPTIVVVAEWGRADTGYTPVAAWSAYVAAAKAAAEATGALFIDLNPLVPNTVAAPDIYGIVGVDKVHPTDKGHQLIADVIVGRLLREWGSSPSTDNAANQPGKLITGLFYKPTVAANKTTTSTGIADVDATNLAVIFTAPASGNVLVKLSAELGVTTGAYTSRWALREVSTVVPGSVAFVTNGTAGSRQTSADLHISGLTPGQLYTWKWAWSVNDAAATATLYCDANRAATMLIFDAGATIKTVV